MISLYILPQTFYLKKFQAYDMENSIMDTVFPSYRLILHVKILRHLQYFVY